MKSDKEIAYRYDLYVVPHWRESLDQMVLQHVEMPRTGSILDVNAGTGGLAIELATSIGNRGEVIATDAQAERLSLARAKAGVKKLNNVFFLEKDPTQLEMEDYKFNLVVGDATLMRSEHIEEMLAEMVRVAEYEAVVALMMLTHGSFGEVFSLLWEALYLCQLSHYAPEIEALINEHQTTIQAHQMMQRQGLGHVHRFTERKELNFDSAQEFFESPLIEDYFLDHWLSFLPDAATRQHVTDKIMELIDRESHESYFEVSVKASLWVGKRQE
jgi:ubiquinone/menaquinone biosynthesis C-methylase UbiE